MDRRQFLAGTTVTQLSPTSIERLYDYSGAPAAGYRLYTYTAGTTTHKVAYTDAAVSVPHTYTNDGSGGQYIPLNSRGELPAPLFLTSGGYDLCLKTAAGATVWTRRAHGADEGANTALAALADTSSTTNGDALIGVKLNATGSTARTQHAKNADVMTAKDFGAVNDGITDDTTYLKAAFDYAISSGRPLVLTGSYLVSGPITSGGTGAASAIASGRLHIICDGDVTITVSGSSTAFMRLITCYTTAINSSSIKGSRLTLDLGSKCACGIYLRHAGATGGSVNFGPVKVLNVYESTRSTVMEVAAIAVYGRYESIQMDSPLVDGVDRTAAGGVCKGISVSDADGQVTINSPNVARVKCTPGTADADGIAVFGHASGGANDWRNATVQVNNPVFTDCQGRSLKFQASDVVVYRPRFCRKSVVSIATAEMDFQIGGSCAVIEPYFDYRKTGSTSPLAATFYPISFQGNCTDRPNRFSCRGGTFRSEVALPQIAILLQGAGALASEVTIDGLELQSMGALGAIVSRCVVEPYIGTIQASSGSMHLAVRNIRGNITGYPWIGANGATATTASNFSWSLIGCENTGALSSSTKAYATLSGTTVNSWKSFLVRDNVQTSDYMGVLVFDFQTLPIGSRFTYDTATSIATNKPAAMGAVGAAFVEVLGQYTGSAGHHSVRVTLGNASAANTVFYTQDGTTWGAIK